MNNLANSYLDLGRHADAVKLHEETLALRKSKLGLDHPGTLGSMSNLADSYYTLGRHADALKLHEETLALMKTKLGPDHPTTLTSMGNLALTYAALGRHGEAIKLGEETLALRKAKLGSGHPHTVSSMANLASSYLDLGRHADALKLNEEALALRKAKFGPDHPDTLGSMVNLALNYAALNRHAEAIKLGEETLLLMRASIPDHHFTFNCMNNLALSYAALGRHAEAIKLGEETLLLMRASIPDHPYTFNCMSNLALSYAALGRHGDALKLNEETLALRKVKLGPDHALTLDSFYNAACSAARAGCGQGKDPPPKEPDRARLRRQALDWLRAILAAYRQQLEKDAAKARPVVLKTMQHWQRDSDFAGVRGSDALANLSESERQEWQKLWQEVAALRQRASQAQQVALPKNELKQISALARQGKHEEAVKQAMELAGGVQHSGAFLHEWARVYALSAAAVRGQTRLHDFYTSTAIELLRQAAANGWRDVANLRNDNDFRELRPLADFQRVLGDMPAK